MTDAITQPNDEMVLQAVINFINARIESRDFSDVDTMIPVGNGEQSIHTVIRMNDFGSLSSIRASDIAVVYHAPTNTWYVSTALTKGMNTSESGEVALADLDIAHHDFLQAQSDVKKYGLHPIHFLTVQKGRTTTPLGVTIDSEVALDGLEHQLHAAAAGLEYAEALQAAGVPVENWVLLRALFSNPSFLRRLVEYAKPGWLVELFKGQEGLDFAKHLYATSSPKDRKMLRPLMEALNVDVRELDLLNSLYLKTAELGNRLVDKVYDGENSGEIAEKTCELDVDFVNNALQNMEVAYSFLANRENKPVNFAHKLENVRRMREELSQDASCAAEIWRRIAFPYAELLLGWLKNAKNSVLGSESDFEWDGNTQLGVLDVYQKAVNYLAVRTDFRLHGKLLSLQFPKETTLARLVWNRMGNEARVSSFAKFRAMGVVSELAKEVDTSRISKDRRVKAAEVLAEERASLDLLEPLMKVGKLYMVVDTSSSMEWAIEHYKNLQYALQSQKPFTLITFGDSQVTVSHNQTQHHVNLHPSGNTPLFPAMDVAYALASQDEDPLIVLFSDLEGNELHPSYLNAVPELGGKIPTSLPENYHSVRTLIVTDKARNDYRFSEFEARYPGVPLMIVKALHQGWSYKPIPFESLLKRIYNALNAVTKVNFYVDVATQTLYIKKAH